MTASLAREVLAERLRLLERVREAFGLLFPALPARLPRGETQRALLALLSIPVSSFAQRAITESLSDFGYDAVKIRGAHFYRLRGRA